MNKNQDANGIFQYHDTLSLNAAKPVTFQKLVNCGRFLSSALQQFQHTDRLSWRLLLILSVHPVFSLKSLASSRTVNGGREGKDDLLNASASGFGRSGVSAAASGRSSC